MKLAALALFFVGSVSAATQSTSTQSGNENTVSQNTIALGINYISETKRYGENDLSSTGIGLDGAYIFHFNEIINLDLAANLRATAPKDPELENVKSLEIGLSPRLAFNIDLGGAVIRPFLETGYYLGQVSADYEAQDTRARVSVDYTTFEYGAGLQVVFANTFAPYVKYLKGNINYSNDIKVDANGQEYYFTGLLLPDTETSKIVAGFSVLF